MNKMVIGIGLPRTGTRSLNKALKILGYEGSHHCELLGTTEVKGETDFYKIDNSFYRHTPYLNNNLSYIMTYRPPDEWRKSIFKFKEYNGPDIEDYKTQCINLFNKVDTRFLIFNILDGWDPLCAFLNKEIPHKKFPLIS